MPPAASSPANSPGFLAMTVGAALVALFPNGTEPPPDGRDAVGVTGATAQPGEVPADLATKYQLPAFPTDLFALAAFLIERGGVYHRIMPERSPSGQDVAGHGDPNLVLLRDDVLVWEELGRAWRLGAKRIEQSALDPAGAAQAEEDLRATIEDIRKIWRALLQCHAMPIIVRPAQKKPLDWWRPAIALLVIADEAALGMGYDPLDSQGSSPFEKLIRGMMALDDSPVSDEAEKQFRTQGGFAHLRMEPSLQDDSVTVFANPYMARVLPKCRTPVVGCTMRTLTHNLALMPAPGIVDVIWNREIGRSAEATGSTFNLLLLPFPFQIRPSCFKPAGTMMKPTASTIQDRRTAAELARPWGDFEVRQEWLRPPPGGSAGTVAGFLMEMVLAAAADAGRIHGLVLPELALDLDTHKAFVEALARRFLEGKETEPLIDFLVCGLSENMDGGELRRGNYVATTTFDVVERGAARKVLARSFSRAKHHRWRLTGPQIRDYGLASALDPNLSWWEAMEVPARKVDLIVYRDRVIFAPLICEDLARIEPCHEPLKAVGPNLVFALLMDGPQLPGRWSARYATTLADDPGSAILTLTSLGLVTRANETGHHDSSRAIGIWKDDTGETWSIKCPEAAQGVVVTLAADHAHERTLDDRLNLDAISIRYQGQRPVRLREEQTRPSGSYGWILHGHHAAGPPS
ncbi:hypothetical protein [Falsiroseomonas sp.]|uniref:hypothetical protein n=1 Tax=Falsiroseomonas sp. TaxID=2870721 RepID=UPI003F6F86AC